MITPLDLENKKFMRKKINGYDPEDVDDFLDELTTDYSKLYKKANESDKEIEDLKLTVDHYAQIESTLQNTLLMAQSAADEVKNAAQKQADQIIRDAESKAKQCTENLDMQIAEKKKELEDINKQFDVYKAKMESLLISQLELLKEVNKDE